MPSWPGLTHGCPVEVSGPCELHLAWAEMRRKLDVEQAVELPAVHEVGADQPGEGERAGDCFLGCLSEAKEQESDQGDGDLDADGILGGAEEAGDAEHLLDPSEEKLDGPATLVESGDLRGGSVEIVAEDAQHLAGVGLDADLAH